MTQQPKGRSAGSAGNSANTHKELLENKFFYWQFIGAKGIILLPSLTTPCLLGQEGPMTIILALHEESFNLFEEDIKQPLKPGCALPEEVLFKLHNHLLLVEWGDGHKEEFPAEDAARRFYQSISTKGNMIYEGWGNALDAIKKQKYTGYYLQRVEESQQLFITAFVSGERRPFGVLHYSAVDLLFNGGYNHLIQLDFDDFPKRGRIDMEQGEMFELVWLNTPVPPESSKYQFENPADTLVIKNFAAIADEALIAPGKQAQKILTSQNAQPEDLPLYRLMKPRATGDKNITGVGPSGVPLNSLAYMTQEAGNVIYAYHPVFFKNKIEKLGVISDIHLSSRQALYKLVKAQVIPGASPADSPIIGQVCHENLNSATYLMDELGNHADILLIAGDIQDHRQNLHPKNCAGKIKNTADLWKFLSFNDGNKLADKSLYPERQDCLMMLELILSFYRDKKRPVFFVAGNHEGYQAPYGLSPRVMPLGKVNPGIPADHNLTIYEAILLYGKQYGRVEKKNNFSGKVMRWLYQVFTPWKDFYIAHPSLSLIGLGWGDGEDFIGSALSGGGTLPRATRAVDFYQTKLAERSKKHEAPNVVLFSHFTHINYAGEIPLTESKTRKIEAAIACDLDRPRSVSNTPATYLSAFCAANHGSFTENFVTVATLMKNNDINYTISGHSHRGAAYVFKNDAAAPNIANTALALPAKPGELLHARQEWSLEHSGQCIALVSGSAGPFGVQNLAGELENLGMDNPQGLILNIATRSVSFVPYTGNAAYNAPPKVTVPASDPKGDTQNGSVGIENEDSLEKDKEATNKIVDPTAENGQAVTGKPRLAVIVSYLKDTKGIEPFDKHYARARGDLCISLENGSAELALTKGFVNLFSGNIIESITLHAIGKKADFSKKPSNISLDFKNTIGERQIPYAKILLAFGSVANLHAARELFVEPQQAWFASFFFSIERLKHNDKYGLRTLLGEHYNLASPWCVPIKTVLPSFRSSYIYIRFDMAEKPDFQYFIDNFPDEFKSL